MNDNKENTQISIIGRAIVGLILLLIGILILWLNEQNVFKTSEAISEAKNQYIEVDSSHIDNANNDKLIVTKGKLKLPLIGATDSDFNVQTNSVKLVRKVEMYQWKESCDDDNGKEKCEYKKTWDDELIASNNFQNKAYQNPTEIPYSNKTFLAKNVSVGKYNLDNTLLKKIETNKKLTVYNNEITMNLNLRSNDEYYSNVQNNSPQIGDIRISYTYADASYVSILAVQKNNTLKPFVSSNGLKIYEIKSGNLTGKQMLQSLTNQNNTQKWLLRFIGTILIIVSLVLIVSPLQFLANFIPIFGNLFGWITSLASIVIGLALSIIVIALSWLFHRPVFAIILLVIAIVIIFLTKKLKIKKTLFNKTKQNIENMPNKELENLNKNNQNLLSNDFNFQNQNINNQINYQNTASRLDGYTEPSTANIHNSVSNIQDDEDIEILDLDD